MRAQISAWIGAMGRRFRGRAGERIGGNAVVFPAHWDDVVEAEPDGLLPGRIEHEARAAAIGFKLPSYRTVTDLERAVDAIRRAEAARQLARTAPAVEVVTAPAPAVATGLAPAMAPDDAANLFVEHLRSIGDGTYGNDDLNRHYSEHCAALGVEPLHQNVLREAMKYVPGVLKRQIDTRSESGKRRREFVWDVQAIVLKRAA